jgi:DNA modification methylase
LSRVEQIGRATLYLGDCLDILPTLGPVDAVICDPPYGVNLDYEGFDDSAENVRELIDGSFPRLREMSQRMLVTCGIARVWDWPTADWILCWAISGAGSSGKWGFNCWQPILAYGKDPYLSAGLGRRPDLIFKNETSEKNGHPCPKPEGFMRLLVERGSFKGETILDPFMGSATTGVAAVTMDRQFIGIEREPKYFDIACKRIEDAQRQGDFFVEAAA